MRLLLLCAFATTPLAAQDATLALRRAEQVYRSLNTLTAEFSQILENPLLGDPEASRGTLFLEPPNRFAMRFSDPEGDRIVADGTWLWAYAPSSVPDQVIRQPIPTQGMPIYPYPMVPGQPAYGPNPIPMNVPPASTSQYQPPPPSRQVPTMPVSRQRPVGVPRYQQYHYTPAQQPPPPSAPVRPAANPGTSYRSMPNQQYRTSPTAWQRQTPGATR